MKIGERDQNNPSTRLGFVAHDVANAAVLTSLHSPGSRRCSYAGPRDKHGNVTPHLLFRGSFSGETIGPHISQLFITPTFFGQQPISQQMVTYQPGVDYMADLTTWQDVQNGIDTGLLDQPDPQLRYLRNGRGLAAFTHVDVLYQAYFRWPSRPPYARRSSQPW